MEHSKSIQCLNRRYFYCRELNISRNRQHHRAGNLERGSLLFLCPDAGERQSRTVVPPCPHPAEMRTAAVRFSAKTPLKNAVLVLSEVRGTGTANFSPLKKSGSVLSETEGQESRSETEVLRMQENTETTRDRQATRNSPMC